MQKEKMSSAERMEAFYSGNKIDRVPCLISGAIYAGCRFGLTAEEFYLNPQKAYDAQIEVYKQHGSDDVPYFDLPLGDLLDFGGKIYISKNKMHLPQVLEYPVNSFNEAVDYVMPPAKDGFNLKTSLEFMRMMKAKGENGVSVPAGSPLSELLYIVRPDLLLKWFLSEPELVFKLLDQVINHLEEVADIIIAEFGVENCSAFAFLPGESNNMISPALAERFGIPYLKKIKDIYKKKGIDSFGIHICGRQNANLNLYKQLNLPQGSYISVDEGTDIYKASEILGKDNIYAGNVPTKYFLMNTTDLVLEYSKELISKMKYNEGGFILTASCSLPLNARPENVDSMVWAAEQYGKY